VGQEVHAGLLTDRSIFHVADEPTPLRAAGPAGPMPGRYLVSERQASAGTGFGRKRPRDSRNVLFEAALEW
jgi:hypothetical protein